MKPTQFTTIANSNLWTNVAGLPHFQGSAIQFITYSLNDATPRMTNAQKRRFAELPAAIRHRKMHLWTEHILDQGHGKCLLLEPGVADIVIDVWRFYDGKRYDLLAWVVMGNHVHLLIAVYPNYDLSSTIRLWKSFTSRTIAKLLDLPPTARAVWKRGYYDRFIRDEVHYAAGVSYIHANPVKAGFVEHAVDWEWSSAEVLRQA